MNSRSRKYKLNTHKTHKFIKGTFEGRLMWNDEFPIVNTEIALVDPSGAALRNGKTDNQGYFSFPGFFPEDCSIECLEFYEEENRIIYVQFVNKKDMTPLQFSEVRYTEYGEKCSAKTDEKGVLKIENLTDRFYYLEINGETIDVSTYSTSEITSTTGPERVYLGSVDVDIAEEEEDFDNYGEEDDDEENDFDAFDLDEIDAEEHNEEMD